MVVLLIRAGSHGEYEQKFIQKIWGYVTWKNFAVRLTELLRRVAPFYSPGGCTHGSIVLLILLQAFFPVCSRLIAAEPLGGNCL